MLIFKKEKRVISLILDHVETTANCVQTMTNGLAAYISGETGDCLSAAKQVNLLESEADKCLRDIRDLLYSGAYLPLIRGDIFKLMSVIDDVCNKTEDCSDFFQFQQPDIPEEYQTEFIVLLEMTNECCIQFKKALRHFFKPEDKPEKVRARCKRVSKVESQIDQAEGELTARIFASPLKKSDKIHLQQCVTSITTISDMIEDAIDRLELVSLKSIV